MISSHSLSDKVALVERKLEVRRVRTHRHWQEVQSDVHRIAQRNARWMPLAGVAAMALIGFSLARQQGATSALVARRAGTTGIWASLVALAATALKIAFSPQGKELWNALRRGRSS